jgi:hypothetical protein
MSYLIHLYKEGNGWRKITPPVEVMAYTNEYKEESDVIARFVREYVHDVNTIRMVWCPTRHPGMRSRRRSRSGRGRMS